MCPAEYRAHMAGARRRMDREEDRDAWTAWHTAALGRAAKFPDFRDFARRGPTTAEASAAALMAKAAQWQARIQQDNRRSAA